MKTNNLLAAFLVLLALNGCKKENKTTSPIDGAYKGSVKLTINQAPAPEVFTGEVSVVLKSKSFSSANNADLITAGAGSFDVNGQELTFVNTEAFPANNLFKTYGVLNGTYTYTIKGDSLLLVQAIEAPGGNGAKLYTYGLKKQ